MKITTPKKPTPVKGPKVGKVGVGANKPIKPVKPSLPKLKTV